MKPVQSVVIFDGVCELCNGAVQFIIKRDPAQQFVFSPAQTPYAQALLIEHGLQNLGLESFVLVENNRAHLRSTAAWRVARNLAGCWPLLSIFKLVPTPLRDWVYDFIGRRRYQWFGQRQHCMVPTAALRTRFRLTETELTREP